MSEVRVYDAPSDLVGRWVREADMQVLRAENARLKAAICDIWNGHGLCEDHGQLGYWKLGKYIDLAIALQPERGKP